ncbi:hypothetical protein DEO72_LG9g1801 [Vigna unguiculata]|uniref:Uncharacterized protein n=1 Tax=Vigna unguiculata TaxID=3917 RepID=A0A4D6N434_VIGUN|nr:hypothetical protein DEO72_LG9g1801 [Vigna unguiculata]
MAEALHMLRPLSKSLDVGPRHPLAEETRVDMEKLVDGAPMCGDWHSILAMEDGLEKEQGSWLLDDALEKEEAFLALGCIGSMRCRKEC